MTSSIKLYKNIKFNIIIKEAKEKGKYIEINSYSANESSSALSVYGGYLIKLDDDMSLRISRTSKFNAASTFQSI